MAVAPIERGPMSLRRTFSGSLESPARFELGARIGGPIRRLNLDLGDTVENGQVVAELDDLEYRQAVSEAEAELAAARADLLEAQGDLKITTREVARLRELHKQKVVTDANLDQAESRGLAAESKVAVAEAGLAKAEAALSSARIRLGYTKVTAAWSGGGRGVVAARHVSEGDGVGVGETIYTIVELDPIIAVVYVGEKDYGLLETGQEAEIRTDAFPGESFHGRVARSAPAFDRNSRQARVELAVENPEGKLKPGMFVRAQIILKQVEQAVSVPLAALTSRNEQEGIFLLNEDGKTVRWQAVQTGIREEEKIQILKEDLQGQVVTMGLQLIGDGSQVTLPETQPETAEQKP